MRILLCFCLALITSVTLADEIRYTYVDGGFSFIGQEDVDSSDYESTDVSGALLLIRGSVGFGPIFYLPASVESLAKEYDGYYDQSDNEVIFSVGGGLHFDFGDVASVYGDAQVFHSKYTFDEDGNFDDSDYEDTDDGRQYRIGVRVAPASLIEFDVNFMRRDYSEITNHIRTIAAQFNITRTIGIGVQWRNEDYRLKYYDAENYFGAYFRFSFK